MKKVDFSEKIDIRELSPKRDEPHVATWAAERENIVQMCVRGDILAQIDELIDECKQLHVYRESIKDVSERYELCTHKIDWIKQCASKELLQNRAAHESNLAEIEELERKMRKGVLFFEYNIYTFEHSTPEYFYG